MNDDPILGYCTNVHAGADLKTAWANLETHAVPVQKAAFGDEPMGVGLWLSGQAAADMLTQQHLPEFRDWLAENRLTPFTFNGFPYGDFHRDVVKHQVYRPAWYDAPRLDYTLALFEILDRLLPEKAFGTISTVPIDWGHRMMTTFEPTNRSVMTGPDSEGRELTTSQRRTACRALGTVIQDLAQRESATGRRMMLCLEPEPGCRIDTTDDAIAWITDIVPREAGLPQDIVTRYLGVCHDVCHAAVMFEDQADVVRRLADAEVSIGKVQVSSAVAADIGSTPEDLQSLVEALSAFEEPRYLHQATLGGTDLQAFFVDLPDARQFLREFDLGSKSWPAERSTDGPCDAVTDIRVHFHVPIFQETLGRLGTTQAEILRFRDAVQTLPEASRPQHWEVETYAWNVLPPDLRPSRLADGIAQEMTTLRRWLRPV